MHPEHGRMQDFGRRVEQAMVMSDLAWARHANPWSVWTRIPILPLLALAIWSRVWIGGWCWLPLGLLIAWTLWNPRAFPPPIETDSWASKGTFGERVWLNSTNVPIPRHHECWARGLGIAAGLSLLPWAWGLYFLEPWAVILSSVLAVAFKLWFVDRMVWLYEDMKHVPEYAGWLRTSTSEPESVADPRRSA